MKKLTLRRMAALTLVVVFLLAFAAPAMAAEYVQATESCQIRRRADPDSGVVGVLSKGVVATKLGTWGQWTRIDHNGLSGYVLSANVKATSAYVSDSATGYVAGQVSSSASSGSTTQRAAMYATSPVNVRGGPGTKYTIVGELQTGDVVYSVGLVSGWRIIEWNGATAYVSAGYLKAYSGSSTSTGTTSASGTWMKAVSPVNVRGGPGTQYSILGELARGETVQRLGVSGSWTKVNYYGRTAYVSSGYLTPSATASTGTVPPAENLNDRLYAVRMTDIRSGPGTGYSRIATLNTGDFVYYTGTASGNWYRVSYGSYSYAYVYRYDVEFWNSSGSGAGIGSGTSASGYVYANSTVPVYSSTSINSSRIGYLYQGDSAQRIANYSNGWYKINYGGGEGFVQSYLVATTSTGWNTGNMYTVNEYRHALSNNVRCYTAPVSSNSYLRGYLSMNESVWVEESNSSWSKCQIQGETMYVRTSDLSAYSGSNYNYNWGGGWGGNNVATVKYTSYAHKSISGDSPYLVGGNHAYIAVNSTVRLLTIPGHSGRVLVEWYEGGTKHTAYVDVDSLNIHGYYY